VCTVVGSAVELERCVEVSGSRTQDLPQVAEKWEWDFRPGFLCAGQHGSSSRRGEGFLPGN